MNNVAKVISVEGEYALVETDKPEACTGDCASCSSCSGGKSVRAKVLNVCNAAPDDVVMLTNSGKKTFILALISYILPIVIFFVFSAFVKNELLCAGVLIAAFLVCATLGNLLSKTKYFMSKAEKMKNADF